MVMRRFVLIIVLVGVCGYVSDIMAQQKRLTVDIENVPVRAALEKIKEVGNVHFVYEETAINKNLRISLSYPSQTSLGVILDDLCRQADLKYEFQGDVVLLYPVRKKRCLLYTSPSPRDRG